MSTDLENHMVIGNKDVKEYTKAEEAARDNQYKQIIKRLENATPFMLIPQCMEMLENSDKQFGVFFHDAVKRGDENLVGKLFLKSLALYRHEQAQKELDE